MNVTHDDILSELARCWAEWSGSDRPITAETNIVQWLKDEQWWRDIDVMDVRWAVSRHFGVKIPADKWSSFFSGQATTEEEWEREVSPTITFARLVDLIQRHLTDVSFAPVNVAGSDCGAAGAFFGLQRLAEHVDPSVERFGPSTRIQDRM